MKIKRTSGSNRRPFLLRLGRRQVAANDEVHSPEHYAPEHALTMNPVSGYPAVLDRTLRPLMTKKEDIEKGEDRKGLWI